MDWRVERPRIKEAHAPEGARGDLVDRAQLATLHHIWVRAMKLPRGRVTIIRPMEVSRRSVLKSLSAATLGAAAGIGAHGFLYERHALQLLHVTLPVSGLAAAHEGLRIGFLTDFHHSAFVSQDDIGGACALVMGAKPDLVVLGGDYVTNADRAYMRPCAEALGSLSASSGVFAILGNHDDEREMPAALARQHFTVLKDARTTVDVKGELLDLVGIRFWTRQRSEIARLLSHSAATTLLLAHDPRRMIQAMQLAIPAVLSGHTHGGQILPPWVGAPWTRKFPNLAGVDDRKGTSLFVSRGVGTVYIPLRLNCPPDVAIVTLRGRT
jgi:predicted MPP superfamily phosphohydrolase